MSDAPGPRLWLVWLYLLLGFLSVLGASGAFALGTVLFVAGEYSHAWWLWVGAAASLAFAAAFLLGIARELRGRP